MGTLRRFAATIAAVALAAAGAVLGPATPAAADVYTQPGVHEVNGRKWSTKCEPYSSTIQRCETHIWATTTKWNGRAWVQSTGWTWNNLTYLQSPRGEWVGNPLATTGEHLIDGRRWKTECDTAWTGYGGCRSMIWATVPERSGSSWRMVDKWVFNNIVNFTYTSAPAKPTGPAVPAAASVTVTAARHPGHPGSSLYARFAPIQVSGRVSGAPAGAVVTVQLRDGRGKAWSTAYAKTRGDGGYTAEVAAEFSGWAQLHAQLDNANSGSLESSIARPAASVTGTAQIGPFAKPTINGSVVPAVGGVVVMPQVWTNGTWTGVGSVRTAADGTFAIPYDFNLGRPGAISLRVQAATAAGALWTSTNSATMTRMRWAETTITDTTPEEINHTWRLGCPVGASRLSTIRTNNWGFDGVMHRGEIIVRKDLAEDVADVFERSLAAGFPIGQMRNPNAWRGDDKQMMAANNTSAFNCRSVVGNPSRQSPHSYGIAVDINPWQNPYRDPTGKWWPSTAHVKRTPVVAGQLTTASEPVRAFRSHGWSWFSGWDWHHFEYRGSTAATTTTTATTLWSSATTAGDLDAADLPQPDGWDTIAREGSEEEGFGGNGTFTHEVDPARKSVDLFALGCAAQPDVAPPSAALEGTLVADGRPGVTLALQFGTDAEAAAWLAAWQSANRGCGNVTAGTDADGTWAAERELHDGLWSETASAAADVVTVTMLNVRPA